MSDEHDSTVRGAFDRLRNDAHEVDTMAALRHIRHDNRPNRIGLTLASAAAVALLLIAGFVVFDNDDRSDVATIDPADSGTDGDEPGDAFDPDGSSWVLASGAGPDGSIQIVDGWPITLVFGPDSVGGTAACNGYGAEYSIDGMAIAIGEVGQESAGCEAAVMDSEAAFLAAFSAVDTIEIRSGNLVLTGPGVELVFETTAPVPTDVLVGRLWLLDSIIADESESPPQGDPATLLLTDEGTVEGSTGCRTFTGEYVVTGNSVVFTSFGMSGECPLQLSDQDNSVVSVLGDGFTAVVDGDRLTLTSRGNEGLGYVATEEAPDGPSTRDAIGVDELLDTRPEAEVTVSGHLIDAGGGWFLCANLDTGLFSGCAGRWVVVTNVGDDLLRLVGPTTESGPSGNITYTEDPVTVSGVLRDDGRFTMSGSDSRVELTPDDEALLQAFVRLDPSSPDPESLSISPNGALIALGGQLAEHRTFDDLSDPSAWALDLEAFRGRTGPFSALDLLGAAGEVSFLVGPHDHCASPPARIFEDVGGARHLSIQPTGIDSCLAWWTVDIFLDGDGDVVAVTLDLWEP